MRGGGYTEFERKLVEVAIVFQRAQLGEMGAKSAELYIHPIPDIWTTFVPAKMVYIS